MYTKAFYIFVHENACQIKEERVSTKIAYIQVDNFYNPQTCLHEMFCHDVGHGVM